MPAMFSFLPPKKILLIEPPFYRFFGYERFHYPMTLTLVGSYLSDLGHDVRIYDGDSPSSDCRPLKRCEVQNNYGLYQDALENREHPFWMEVRETIEGFKPDVVGLTSITAKMDSTDMVAGMVRQLYGNKVRIVLGGPHAYGMRVMRSDYDFGADYDEVVLHIPNLVDQTPNKKLIMNLEQYSPKNLSTIITTTGCPMECTFCGRSFDRRFVYRNVESIREELEEIRRYKGNPPVYVADDCIMSHSKHFTAVVRIIKELGLKFATGCRIMALTPHKLETFLDSGGTRILVGVESGSQKILDRVKKRLKVEDIVTRTKWLNEASISWSAFIMVGFPFETLEDLKLTEELIYTIRPTFVSINRFTPYPGTEIYKEFFLDTPIRFRDLFQLNSRSVVQLPDEMEEYIDRMFVEFDKYNDEIRQN